jgi:NADPH:quinone reductase
MGSLPLIVSGWVKPMVEQVYPFGKAGEALRHLIEDRPFGTVVLPGPHELATAGEGRRFEK